MAFGRVPGLSAEWWRGPPSYWLVSASPPPPSPGSGRPQGAEDAAGGYPQRTDRGGRAAGAGQPPGPCRAEERRGEAPHRHRGARPPQVRETAWGGGAGETCSHPPSELSPSSASTRLPMRNYFHGHCLSYCTIYLFQMLLFKWLKSALGTDTVTPSLLWWAKLNVCCRNHRNGLKEESSVITGSQIFSQRPAFRLMSSLQKSIRYYVLCGIAGPYPCSAWMNNMCFWVPELIKHRSLIRELYLEWF